MNNPTSSHDALRAQLAALERKLPSASAAELPRLHNQAGDMHTRLGQFSQALGQYGHAVDAYVSQGETHQAIAVCTKMIRRSPNVTRTHFTLACLLLYEGQKRNAIGSIASYAAATRDSSTASMAIPRLRFLARCVADPEVLEAIASQLDVLGDTEGSAKVRSRTPSESDQDEGFVRDARLLDAAVQDSAGLWADFWLK